MKPKIAQGKQPRTHEPKCNELGSRSRLLMCVIRRWSKYGLIVRSHLSTSQFEEIAGQPLARASLLPDERDSEQARACVAGCCWVEMGSSCRPGTLPTFWGGQGRTERPSGPQSRPRPCLHYFAAVTHSVMLRYPRVTAKTRKESRKKSVWKILLLAD